MFYSFGKKKAPAGLPAPDEVAAGAGEAAFGRYLRYGRKTLFGRRYFGGNQAMMKPMAFGRRYPQFGNQECGNPEMMKQTMNPMGFGRRYPQFGNQCGNQEMMKQTTRFGRRRRYRRKAGKKGKKSMGKKPPASLMKACRKHRIKCTKKVGKKLRYKKISVLKKQLRKKRHLKKRKSSKKRKGSKRRKSTRRRRSTRFSLFGIKL